MTTAAPTTTMPGLFGGIVTAEAIHVPAVCPVAPKATPAIAPGAFVKVRHVGLVKVGEVVTVARVRGTVRVPIHGGKSTKVITVRLAELALI